MRSWFKNARPRRGFSRYSCMDCPVQICESRVLPAGIVTVTDSTDFTVVGDNSDNSLEIYVGDESVVVVPLNGTRLKVNGFTYDPDESVEFDGPPVVLRDAVVDMKGGHDSLLVRYASSEGEIRRNVKVSMGTGNDKLLIQVDGGEVVVRGTTSFDLGAGNDTFVLEGGQGFDGDNSGITLRQSLTVTGGAGNDVIGLRGIVAKTVKIDTGTDNDILDVEGLRVGADWTVALGAGVDQMLAQDVTVTGKAAIDAGAGDDRVLLNAVEFRKSSSVKMQSGKDVLVMDFIALSAGMKLDVAGGSERDILQSSTINPNIRATQFEDLTNTHTELHDEIVRAVQDSIFAALFPM